MKIKKFDEKENEIKFSAKSLERTKDDKPGFKTSVDDQEKVEKEFKKEMDKIEKFESWNIEWKDMSDDERKNMEIPAYKELDFVKHINKCNCCDKCTGEPGCYCGCEDCTCEGEISEAVKYHLDNNKPITENIFRPGSDAFYEVIKEARMLFDSGKINLTEIDREIYESTEIGKFATFNGELVPLDLPMEYYEELKEEAEYKGKEVKLNYPMRGGSKKYYVYVKNPKTGKVKKISFGDTTGLTAKVGDPEARRSFAARHKCSTKKDKTKAGYWACRINKYGHLWGGKTYPGYW